MFWIAVHEIALARPRSGNLALGFRPRPKPAGINVTVSDASDEYFVVIVVDFLRVNVFSKSLLCNLTALMYAFVGATTGSETVYYGVAHL